jgi:acetyl-CoA/propionyl-CoA carboxylase biotin carboxyl carrier protein
MNTRLQVEHPVTELVTGIDIVEQQIRVAAGLPLGLVQGDVHLDGHAVEVRTYAEDPSRGFLPTGGRVLRLDEPTGDHIRVDSSLYEGTVVGSTYDPMLNKVIAWGPDRATAFAKLDRALSEQVILGVTTNTSFLRRLITHPAVLAGELDTGFIERHVEMLTAEPTPNEALAAFALHAYLMADPLWGRAWRPSGPAPLRWLLALPDRTATVSLQVGEVLRVDDETVHVVGALVGDDVLVTLGGRTTTWHVAKDGPLTWVGSGGASWVLAEQVRSLPVQRS